VAPGEAIRSIRADELPERARCHANAELPEKGKSSPRLASNGGRPAAGRLVPGVIDGE
jgi:hypothetical protein